METEASFVPQDELKPPKKEPLTGLRESFETVQQLVAKLKSPIPEEIKAQFVIIGDEASCQSIEKALATLAKNLETRLAKVNPNTDFSDKRAEMTFRINFFDDVRPVILVHLHEMLNDSWRGSQQSDHKKSVAWTLLTNYLKQICESSDFQVTEPKMGEIYNDEQHVVKDFADNPGPHNTIASVRSLGLKINEEIKEKAGVWIYR